MPGLLMSSEKDLRGTAKRQKLNNARRRSGAARPGYPGRKPVNVKSPASGQAFVGLERELLVSQRTATC
jgi:hypothetical protein